MLSVSDVVLFSSVSTTMLFCSAMMGKISIEAVTFKGVLGDFCCCCKITGYAAGWDRESGEHGEEQESSYGEFISKLAPFE